MRGFIVIAHNPLLMSMIYAGGLYKENQNKWCFFSAKHEQIFVNFVISLPTCAILWKTVYSI